MFRRDRQSLSKELAWRKQQLEGVFDRTEPPVRGPKPRVLDDRDRRLAQLEQDKALLERKVHQQTLRAQKAEAQVAFQKKVACLLGADISELRDDVC